MKQRQRRIHCKHFSGVTHPQCKAGCAYVPGHIDQCIGRGVDATAPCQMLEYPTQAEIDAEDAESAARFEKIVTARAAIVKHMGGKGGKGGKGGSERINCPNCGGVLYFCVASNGHIHALCRGACGVAWME